MKISLATLLASAMLLPAIATAGPLSPYSALIIGDISADNALISNVQADREKTFDLIREKMVSALADSLVTRLQGDFPTVRRSREKVEILEKAAIIEGSFTAIDAGRRGLRMWIGFSGTAAATLQVKVVDGGSGNVLAVFEQERSAPLGWAGSERVLLQITDQLAESLAEFLKKLR